MQARNGAGLAAPQIGSSWRVVIYGTGSPNPRYPEAPIIRETVLINPVVEQIGTDTQTGWEGCLSVPGLRGEVTRWQRVDVRAMDQKGLMIQRRLDGFEARVVQDVQRSTLWTVNPRDQLNLGLMHVQRAAQGQRRRDICGWIGCVR
jgi:peptide deformylase